ncbi:hypothetical protein X943_003119 [Babesia divergens]|uniref:Uncharacterized protein n=1 Tax=Babesia divergens TaxID=32595 RepID=A0AAD9G7P2_BABDI|nr:hypothetical protein X943_003119 [Babesia divergens]
MRRDPNTSKLMAIEPQSLAEDVHWFLDGLDSPHAPYDLDPFSNPKTCHLFDNADTPERRDSIDSSRSERAVEVLDGSQLGPKYLAHMKAVLKRVAQARGRWQDEIMTTFLDHEEEISEFATDLNYCDSTLRLVEEALMKHYKRLETASTSIMNLYSESEELSVSLENRKAFLDALKKFLDDVTISPKMIMAICREPLSNNYLKLLNKFKQKADKIRNVYPEAQYPALNPSRIQVKKLELVILRRICDFMRVEIAQLAAPKTNLQLIQSTYFIRLQPLYAYVRDTNPVYSEEIKNQYSNTLRKVYHHLFSNYYASLEGFRMKNHYREVGVIMKQSSRRPEGYFKLQDRDHLVKTYMDNPMVPTGIQPDSLHMEGIVKSFLKLLSDTAASEYMLISQFFGEGSDALFLYIFEETLGYLRSRLDGLRKSSYDVVMLTAVLLLIGLNRKLLCHRGLNILADQLSKLEIDMYEGIVGHIKTLVEHVAQQAHQAAPSTVESWLPGGFSINVSNMVHALQRLKELQVEYNLNPFDCKVLDEVLESIQSTLCVLGRKVTNPLKGNIVIIANCAAFLPLVEETNIKLSLLKNTLEQHLKSYVNGHISTHFEDLLKIVNGMKDTQNTCVTEPNITAGTTDQWRKTGDEFLTTLTGKFMAIQGKVKLHFVQKSTASMVLSSIVETIETLYTTFHSNVVRFLKVEDQGWMNKLPAPGSLRQSLMPNAA